MVAWGVVARTAAIDRLIEQTVRTGVDTVLNLGAGLDTRPYRLKLPTSLRWVEVDFSRLLDYKTAALRNEAPQCRLEHVGIDLTDREKRREMLAKVVVEAGNALVLTEGVLTYFRNSDVSALANDLNGLPGCQWWLMDFDNAGRRSLPRGWEEKLAAAPFLFEPDEWFSFFRRSGWQTSTVITTAEESARIRRPYPWDLPYGLLMRALPKSMRENILSLSGAALLRNEAAGTRIDTR